MRRKLRAGESFHRGPRSGGQLQHQGRAGQLFAPVSQLLLHALTGQEGPLPYGIIGILNWQLRKSGTAIERRQFFGKHCERPSIAHDVVRNHNQHVIVFGDADQPRAQQGRDCQIEWLARFFTRQMPRFFFGPIFFLRVRKRYSLPRLYNLHRFAIRHAKARP